MHREVTKVTGTYMLREQSEAHAVNFAVESDALRQQTTIGDENAEIAKRERSPTCSENPGEFVCIPPKNTIKRILDFAGAFVQLETQLSIKEPSMLQLCFKSLVGIALVLAMFSNAHGITVYSESVNGDLANSG